MPDKTPRERFVEAMYSLWSGCDLKSVFDLDFQNAADAFADQECDIDGPCRISEANPPGHEHRTHESCRAALRKEIGL